MNERFVRTIQKADGRFAILIRQKCQFHFCAHLWHRDNNLSFDELSDFFEFVEVPIPESLRSKYPDSDAIIRKISHLPELFRLYLQPFLTNATSDQFNQYIGYFWALDLKKNRSLLAGVSRMASWLDHAKTLSWCEVLQYQQPNRRSLFVTLLLKSGVFKSFSGEVYFSLWQTMVRIRSRKNYPLRLWVLMNAITKKIKLDSILAGLQLVSDSYLIYEIHRCDNAPIKMIRNLDIHVQKAKEYNPSFAYEIWQACGTLKGFSNLLKSFTDFRSLSPDECLQFFDIFCDLGTREPHMVRPSFWERIRCGTPMIWKNLLSIPQDRRTKFIQNIASLMNHYLSSRIKQLVDVLILLNHLCADQRFLKLTKNFAWTAADLFAAAGHHKRALIFAPVSSWFRLDEEGQQDYSIIDGLERMLKIIPLFTCKSFSFFPQKLFHVASRFGILPEGMDKKILSEFLRHPIYMERFGKKSDLEIVEYFQNTKSYSNPVPKKFQHYVGRLSNARRKRYRKIFNLNLNLTRLEVLDQCIKTHLNHWPELNNENILHSVLMFSGKTCNSRASKRFLKAYIAGKKDYILQHPRTVDWIRKHDFLDASLWMKGISMQFETEAFGSVRLEVEQDPLEAWKLGTYVQSCLAVGGLNHHFAAAAVLDMNKRVVYARNTKGQVVARQLLAISEERTLVCFSVYPVKICSEIKRIFRKYDRKFAETLKIPIHVTSEPYTVATILARGWYDDDAWNLAK